MSMSTYEAVMVPVAARRHRRRCRLECSSPGDDPYLGLLTMHPKELGIKRCQFPCLQFSTSLRHILVHDMLPLAFVICDHVFSRDEVLVKFAGRT